jgi:hypothetical protein
LLELEVHRLHDDAHATAAEHALDAVPARKYGADRHAIMARHELATWPLLAARLPDCIDRIVRSMASTIPENGEASTAPLSITR